MNRKSLSVCRKQSRLNVTLTQGKKSLIIEHSDMHLPTNNKAMGAGNLIPKSSGKIFQYYSTSVIYFINGVMFLSMSGFFFFDICRELSHQWPWDWQICLGTWSWARESVWVSLRLDGTVRSNHLKLGIKFLNHRWIIILSICTTNPRLNERYTTTVPVRQKINHSLHSPKEIGAIHWKSIFKN